MQVPASRRRAKRETASGSRDAIDRRSAQVQRAPQMSHVGNRTYALIHERAISPLSV
jgi:hypothetical protein